MCNTTQGTAVSNPHTAACYSFFNDNNDYQWIGKIEMNGGAPLDTFLEGCLDANIAQFLDSYDMESFPTGLALLMAGLLGGAAVLVCIPFSIIIFGLIHQKCYFHLRESARARSDQAYREIYNDPNVPDYGSINSKNLVPSPIMRKQLSMQEAIQQGITTIDGLKDYTHNTNLTMVEIFQVIDPDANIEIPERYTCKYITYDIMSEPVLTAKGHIYDRTAILRWWETRATEPATGLALNPEDQVAHPNNDLKKDIVSFVEEEIAKYYSKQKNKGSTKEKVHESGNLQVMFKPYSSPSHRGPHLKLNAY